jgi:hypothetical protein
MLARTLFILALGAVNAQDALAEGCRLDHATYRESKSGAEIQFRPKDTTVDDTLTTGLFRLKLPKVKDRFEGDITWNAGGNARPDGEIGRTCMADEDADGGHCWLWTGNTFTLDGMNVGMVEDADMAAPKALLFSDFGRSLLTTEPFVRANPELHAFDVFALTGCSS